MSSTERKAGFTYSVVSAAPRDVRPDLCRLWQDNLTLATGAEAKFTWLYEAAPDTSDIVFLLQAADGEGLARSVGTTGVVPRRYHVGGRAARAAICADLAVDREHRGLLPALRLVRAARELLVARFDLAYGFPNDKAQGVLLRAGFSELGKTTRYAKVLRHGAYADRLASRENVPPVVVRAAANPFLKAVGGALVDGARLAAKAPETLRSLAQWRLSFVDGPDPRFDGLWESARGEYDVVGARTARFLEWRYPPGGRAQLVTLERRLGRELRAYAVVEPDVATGATHVRDLFGHHDDLPALIALLLPALYARGAASVSVRFLGAPRIAGILAAHGFDLRPGERTVVVQVGASLPPEHGPLVTDANRWHLFDLDEDA